MTILLGGVYGPEGIHTAESHRRRRGPVQQQHSQYQTMNVPRQQNKMNVPENVSLSRRKKFVGALRDKLPGMRDRGLKWNKSYIVS